MENDKFDLAWRLVEHTGANVFITGRAGTGKTTFLKRLKSESAKSVVVLAPTGIAALNAGGMTIHSFFQLSFSPYIPGIGQSEESSRFRRFAKDKIKILRSLDTIVIDEISMVRADVLDAIDSRLRKYRNPTLPFGGVQMVMIGDIQQLPPVAREEEWQLLKEHYRSPYFFDSHVLLESSYETIEFTKVYRQKDSCFLNILNAIRDNKADRGVLETLNRRFIAGFNPDKDEKFIRLTTHNRQATQINDEKMRSLEGEEYLYEARIEGDFPEMIYPADPRLKLKKGAQVMFVRNDSSGARRYYNGLIGHISNIDENGVVTVVTEDCVQPIEVEEETWENTAYSVDEKDHTMKEKVIGRFSQLPLRAAWAITIHKSQGLTFDKAIINASAAFAHGQAYVALSRCRTLEGLVLDQPLPPNAIICDRTVSEFEKDCSSREATDDRVTNLQADFNNNMNLEIADLTGMRNAMEQLHRTLQLSHASTFPKITAQFGELFNCQFKALMNVSFRFQAQLRNMAFSGDSEEKVYDRLKAASAYYLKELRPIFHFIRNIPADIDNKQNFKKFSDAISLMEHEAKLKVALMEWILERPISVNQYLKIKREVSLSNSTWLSSPILHREQKKSCVKKSMSENRTDIENPELFHLLNSWRRSKAKEDGSPDWMVLGTKTLVWLSNEMPEDEIDLLTIPGIGRKKLLNYGEELLEMIDKFRRGIKS